MLATPALDMHSHACFIILQSWQRNMAKKVVNVTGAWEWEEIDLLNRVSAKIKK